MIWKEYNLLNYGKYFCNEIDAALVRGFNPDLEIEVVSTRTNDGLPCDFIFKDAKLSFFKLLGLAYKKKIRPGKMAIMGWEYHTGHLYKTLGDVIKQTLRDKADEILEDGLEDFSSFSSEKHIAAIKKYQNTDFDKLP